MRMNRFANTRNHFQGTDKKVLTVCSAGLLRSPTMALVLAQDPWNFNTRSCGFNKEYALIVLEPILVYWADEIVAANEEAYDAVMEFDINNKLVHNFNIPDMFPYRAPELVDIIKDRALTLWG